MSMLIYELKTRKTSLLFFVAGTIYFVLIHFLMIKTPQLVIAIAQVINRSDALRNFMGLQEKIEAITHENLMIAALVVFYIPLLYVNIKDIANSIEREERFGTILYFLSQPVSKVWLAASKLLVSIVIFLAEMAVWGLVVWRFSLYGAKDIAFFYHVITEDMQMVMAALVSVGILAIALGFLYGCLAKRKRSGYFSGNVLFLCTLIALFPNFLRIYIGIMVKKGMETAAVEKIVQIFVKIREFDPVYWCNPAAVIGNDGNIGMGFACRCLLVSILMAGIGCWWYAHRCSHR